MRQDHLLLPLPSSRPSPRVVCMLRWRARHGGDTSYNYTLQLVRRQLARQQALNGTPEATKDIDKVALARTLALEQESRHRIRHRRRRHEHDE